METSSRVNLTLLEEMDEGVATLIKSTSEVNRSEAEFKDCRVILPVISHDCPRAHWPLKRVLKVFSGQDGHVRVSKIQIGQNTVMRPVSKCVPLESILDERRCVVKRLTESRGGECSEDIVYVRSRMFERYHLRSRTQIAS